MTLARHVTTAIASTVIALSIVTTPAVAADRRVTMSGNAYRPPVVTINAGDSVTWRNDDAVPHDAAGNGWSTSLLTTGGSDAVTFRRAGRYAYLCTIHPGMRGTVVVQGARGGATVPPTDADSPSTVRTDPPGSWVAVPLVLIAGSALLMALIRPRRGRSET